MGFDRAVLSEAEGLSPNGGGVGVALFAPGWEIPLVGHRCKGRKPAFADDLAGLRVGPLFALLELLAVAGACRDLRARIAADTGPARMRDLTGTAA
jgi:uncharacterized membrane protein YGL010W